MTINSNMQTVLVFRIGQLGDTLVSMPAIKQIRDRFPGCRIILLTDRWPENSGYVSSWSLFEPTGWIDGVIYYDPLRSLKGKVFNLFRVARHIRKLRPNRVFLLTPERSFMQAKRDSMFFHWFSGVAFIHGCSVTPNYRKRPEGMLPRVEPEWKRLLRLVGNEGGRSTFVLPVPNEERDIAIKMLKKNGLFTGSTLIAIGPGSKMASKRWPASRFVLVGKALLDWNEDVHLVVLGGKEDSGLGNQLCRQWGDRSHNFAGILSIHGSAAVLSQCELYVGNDTGTMHLAAMVGTKCVALFSARDYPGKWEPYGEGHCILRHDIECAGCMLETCVKRGNKCLKAITVEEVLSAAFECLRVRDWKK